MDYRNPISGGPAPVDMFLYDGLLIDDNGNKHKPGFGIDSDCIDMRALFNKYKNYWNENWRITFGPYPIDWFWNEQWYERYNWNEDPGITAYWYQYYHDYQVGIPSYMKNMHIVYYNFCIDEFCRPFIQYWFFYPFNDPDPDLGHKHEGDWELVNVVFSSQIPEISQPIENVYFFHNYYLKVPEGWQEGWKTYWNFIDNTHLVVCIGGDINVLIEETPILNDFDKLKEPKKYEWPDWSENTGASFPFEAEWIDVVENPWGDDFDERVDAQYMDDYIPYTEVEVRSLESGDDSLWWLIFPGEWGRRKSDYPNESMVNAPKNPTHHRRFHRLYGDPEIDKPHNGNCQDLSEIKYIVKSDKYKESLLSFINSPTFISIYPNPYSTSATISIPQKLENESEPITISIYDISGRLVRKETTTSSLTWDLTSTDGQPVSNGIYLVNISTTKENKVLRLLVAR
ncbi:MAG: T9SS type A sorting domain-containing protein [bacterium]